MADSLSRDPSKCWRCGTPLHPGHYCGAGDNPIVGHKAFLNEDGSYRHELIKKDEADAIFAACEADRQDRANRMPDQRSALDAMFSAWLRLKELGWKEAIYCPKDGAPFEIIEAGSTGIFDAHYTGDWPNGHIVSFDGSDSYCSRPGGAILYKRKMIPKKSRQEQ